jgi:hypothetical protein
LNRFGDSWDAAKVETLVGIECGHCGERVAVAETPHQ